MTVSPLTDAALLADRTDPAGSFALFYRRHAQMILQWCARRRISAHDAADVTSEVFIAALSARYTYDANLNDSAEWWLRGIAFNVVAGQYRQSGRERAAHDRLHDGTRLTEADVAEYAAMRAELGDAIDQIEGLPADQRSALVSRRLDGAEYADMAQAAGVSQQVIRRRVSRAVDTIKKRMDDQR